MRLAALEALSLGIDGLGVVPIVLTKTLRQETSTSSLEGEDADKAAIAVKGSERCKCRRMS